MTSQMFALMMKQGINPIEVQPHIPSARKVKGRHPIVSTLEGRNKPRMSCGDLTLWGDK